MRNKNTLPFSLASKWKSVLDEIDEVVGEIAHDVLKTDHRTLVLIEKMAQGISSTHSRAIDVEMRYRGAVEAREAFSFIAYLYFDYTSEFLSGRLKVTRQVIHHYCESTINKYKLYPEFKKQILLFFSEEDMEFMIEKFKRKKWKKRGEKNKGQIEEVR